MWLQPPPRWRRLPFHVLLAALSLLWHQLLGAEALSVKSPAVHDTRVQKAGGSRKHLRGGGAHHHSKASKRNSSGVDVYYASNLLDKLKVVTEQRWKHAGSRHDSEVDRLSAAKDMAVNATDKALIEETIAHVNAARSEEEDATFEMLGLYYTVKSLLGAKGAPPPSCNLLECGPHAECEIVPMFGARCRCQTCFTGDGFVCAPSTCHPAKYLGAMPLVGVAPGAPQPSVAEVHVTVFANNLIAVVFRDTSDRDRGFLQMGHASEDGVGWGERQAFSGDDPAFGPVVTVHDSGRLAIAYRDKDRGGTGFVVGGYLQPPGPNRSMLSAFLLEPYAFAKEQAQKMVLVPLSASRAVCLYAGHLPASNSTAADGSVSTAPAQAFGGVLLLQLLEGGALNILGKYRFAEGFGAISRLAATQMSPDSLVVAYRALPLYADDPNPTAHELSAAYIGMSDEELVIGGHTLEMEPDKGNMWARSVAMVSENMFAYSYQSGSEKMTKVAIVEVHPESHLLTLVGQPHVIGEGDAQFVQAVTLATGLLQPHTFTYFQHSGEMSSAEVCPITATGEFGACSQVAWSDTELKAASAARLRDGRLLFVYARLDGAPFTTIFGAEEFLQD